MKAVSMAKINGAQISAVDLFCGVGGLTYGLRRAGIDVVAGLDVDASCRYPYESNNRTSFIEADVRNVSATGIAELFQSGKPRLLAGCAPCQPFSTYARPARARAGVRDWSLVAKFAEIVREVKPELVTMENVPQLADHAVFDEFLESLDGYSIWWSIVQCAEMGVPQSRKRLVLMASNLGPDAPKLAEQVVPRQTVRETIEGLPRLEHGGRSASDPLHVASRLSELNLRRIKVSRPGGSWRDWPVDLRATCHKRTSGATFPSVYGRMEWDSVSPTITTQCFGFGNGRFGHPEQDRAISLREAALLQTFPPNYKFVTPGERVRFNRLGRLIGNAVPPKLGEAIGHALRSHVQIVSPSG